MSVALFVGGPLDGQHVAIEGAPNVFTFSSRRHIHDDAEQTRTADDVVRLVMDIYVFSWMDNEVRVYHHADHDESIIDGDSR